MRYMLALSAILVVLTSGNVVAEPPEPEYLNYDKFLEKVRADEVKSLTLGPWQYMKGTYSEGDTEKEFFSQRPLEAASDTLLTELLEEHEVKVVQEPPPEPSIMAQLAQYGPFVLLLPLPSILLVIVLIYLVRLRNKINQMVIR